MTKHKNISTPKSRDAPRTPDDKGEHRHDEQKLYWKRVSRCPTCPAFGVGGKGKPDYCNRMGGKPISGDFAYPLWCPLPTPTRFLRCSDGHIWYEDAHENLSEAKCPECGKDWTEQRTWLPRTWLSRKRGEET